MIAFLGKVFEIFYKKIFRANPEAIKHLDVVIFSSNKKLDGFIIVVLNDGIVNVDHSIKII